MLPEALVPPFKLMKSTADVHSSVLSQATADAYLRMGRLPRRMAEARALYARKARALANGLREAGGFDFEAPPGGMFLWARLPDGVDAAAFSRHAVATQSVAAVRATPSTPKRPRRAGCACPSRRATRPCWPRPRVGWGSRSRACRDRDAS